MKFIESQFLRAQRRMTATPGRVRGQKEVAPVFSRDIDAELAYHDIPTFERRRVQRLAGNYKHEDAERLRLYLEKALSRFEDTQQEDKAA